MSARALNVLERFPLHLAATDPEKRFEVVVSGLTEALEVLTRQVAHVRSSHRLSEAPTVGDVRSLAALHGLSAHLWDLLMLRVDAVEAAAAANPIDTDLLGELFNVTEEQLIEVVTGGGDLAVVAASPARDRASLSLRREVVRSVIHAHAVGNATATSLLTATAGYLGLEVEGIVHTEERWWHLASCRDLLRLVPAAPLAEVEPLVDLVALEENPFRAADIAPAPKKHGQGFQIIRGGIDDVTVTARVIGVGTRTVRPMVVQCHAGRGLVFEGNVPDAAELRFEASGRVTLDGTDVTGSAWSFEGAVFGSTARPASSHDFVFGGGEDDDDLGDRRARFVTTTPLADALDATAAFPHGSPTVTALPLPRGVSRWAAFVRIAHASGPAGTPPRTKLGRFDASVFAEADGPDGTSAGEPSMRLGFAWEEREPFAVRLLLPRRLQVLDDEQGNTLRQPLRRRLDRHRAAGVDVRVEYADPRWTLGTGVVRDEADDAIGTVLAGTALWTDGTAQPPNG